MIVFAEKYVDEDEEGSVEYIEMKNYFKEIILIE